MAIARPDALAEAAAHRSRSRPGWTPRSCEIKIERNGKAKLKPKIAVNSANQSAARLRFQSTALGGGVLWVSGGNSRARGRGRATSAGGRRLRPGGAA